jgi:alkaline phosphatase
MLKKILLVSTSVILVACSSTQLSHIKPAPVAELNQPLNIIMVVADGMGPAFTSAYKFYHDDPATPEMEATWFDRHHIGMSTTYPAHVSGLVTDSAASATALAAGIKSYNGAIGVDVDKNPVRTVLHAAKANGMKTGLAVTSQIVHATPAAYIAHNESRRNYDAIANQYFDLRYQDDFWVDVMLGGGTAYFDREDRNLAQEFTAAGYVYATEYAELAQIQVPSRVLGLFAEKGLPWALDDPQPNRLRTLTEHALTHLQNDEGFFLLVEASQVDWAGHANDIAGAMAEMQDLHDTLLLLEEFQRVNPNTLVILTADHSTGGLTLAKDGEYRWSPEYLHHIPVSVESMVLTMQEKDMNGTERVQYLEQVLAFDLTVEQEENVVLMDLSQGLRKLTAQIKPFIDAKTNTGWTTSGHTAIDVQVYASGPHADKFAGQQDNTDIAKAIFAILDK